MDTNDFQFKKFTIKQEHCAFKVGTDSVILGAWANPENALRILDIGTGSGVLALMMAQKSSAEISAIDIDQGAFTQAKVNVENSTWKNRIQIHHSSIQDYADQCPHTFDIIITNPPYFSSKIHADGTSKATARNNSQLPFDELAKASIKLLSKNGKLYLVLPTDQALRFRKTAEKAGLVLSKLLRVQTKPGESFEKRHLMLFQKTTFHYSEEILVIEKDNTREYTDAYRKLTQDFYLAF